MRCIVCGCTEEFACEGGCSWAARYTKDRGVCSSCPIPVPESMLTKIQKRRRQALTSILAKVDRRARATIDKLKVELVLRSTAAQDMRNFERSAIRK